MPTDAVTCRKLVLPERCRLGRRRIVVGRKQTARRAWQPKVHPLHLRCRLASFTPGSARLERRGFLHRFSPEARAMLTELPERYAAPGTAQFVIPDVLKDRS
jgi:hypothetical protein